MAKPFRNKEISWLAFNARVLQEASDRTVPLIERMRFLGIFSSNQDEFYRVRVATLHRLARLGKKGRKLLGHDPRAVLKQIKDIILEQQGVFQSIYRELLEELSSHGLHLIDESRLTADQGEFVKSYFRSEVRPKLTPLMVREKTKFPELRDKSIYLATRLRSRDGKNDRFALIEVPTDVVPRFLMLPQTGRDQYVILLEDVIRYNLQNIFSLFEFETIESHLVKLTRDAELDIDDDVTESYVRKVVKSIKQREEGNPVRLVYDRDISEDFRKLLARKLSLKTEDSLVPSGRTHNNKDFIDFPRVARVGRQALLYPTRDPVSVPAFDAQGSIFAAIREREILLHTPYQPFEYVIDLLREAAIDPKVLSIKVTLYRVARHSGVATALLNAARNGKQVTAIIELQARFDEEANVALANHLQKEGAQVIFGVPGLKVHAKIGLITRREKGKLVRYAFLGTGNLNEDTAKTYSDQCLFTRDRRLTREVGAVFDFLQDNYRVASFKHLIVAPFGFREAMTRLIGNEIRNAQKGKDAYINLKLNNIADPDIVGLLHEAADSGVKLKLNVRGMYSILPSAVKKPENIDAIGIIDRYLEHSRIFVFANGGKKKVFLSSGDWMTRNFDRRVEVTFPIYDAAVQSELEEFLDVQWRDNAKARILDERLSNQYRVRRGEVLRSQTAFYDLLRARSMGQDELKPKALA